MKAVEKIVSGAVPPNVYRLRSRAHASTIIDGFATHGWRCFPIQGRAISDKASFLVACQDAFALPAYFGHNWDALDECLNDLSWAPAAGYAVLYDHVDRLVAYAPHDWYVALEILCDAMLAWAETPTPMYILLRYTGRAAFEALSRKPPSL